MNTTNAAAKLTAETITDKQIRQLSSEAAQAGDLIQVDLCNIALSGEDSDGTGTTLGTPCTVEYARQACADVINNARAQE